MNEAIAFGISRYTLYSLHEGGYLDKLSRGVYRLSETPPPGNPDLAIIGSRYPSFVVCLISALSYHELTTQIPRTVTIAIPRNARVPTLEYPPITAYRFSNESFEAGVEIYNVDGINVRIYSAEKTLADCFKFRNRIGIDIALEALRTYRSRGDVSVSRLLRYADVCRVRKIMEPYIEALF